MTEYAKLTVNLNAETAEALRWMMQAEGKSATNVVREALSLMYFYKRKSRKGWKLAIFKGRKVREVMLDA